MFFFIKSTGASCESNAPSYYVVTRIGSQVVARIVPDDEVVSELNSTLNNKQSTTVKPVQKNFECISRSAARERPVPVRSQSPTNTRSAPTESANQVNNENPNAPSFYIIKGSGPRTQTSQPQNVLNSKVPQRVYHPTIYPDPNSPTDYYDVAQPRSGRNRQYSPRIHSSGETDTSSPSSGKPSFVIILLNCIAKYSMTFGKNWEHL